MDIDMIGDKLEMEGLSHSQIDDYFLEHFGVKGMQWGVRKERRAQNRALNRESRKKDIAKARADIDKSRAKLDSGKSQAALKKARQEYKTNKTTMGSREARKILAKEQAKFDKDWAQATQVRDGKELATSMLIGGAAALAVAVLKSR